MQSENEPDQINPGLGNQSQYYSDLLVKVYDQ